MAYGVYQKKNKLEPLSLRTPYSSPSSTATPLP